MVATRSAAARATPSQSGLSETPSEAQDIVEFVNEQLRRAKDKQGLEPKAFRRSVAEFSRKCKRRHRNKHAAPCVRASGACLSSGISSDLANDNAAVMSQIRRQNSRRKARILAGIDWRNTMDARLRSESHQAGNSHAMQSSSHGRARGAANQDNYSHSEGCSVRAASPAGSAAHGAAACHVADALPAHACCAESTDVSVRMGPLPRPQRQAATVALQNVATYAAILQRGDTERPMRWGCRRPATRSNLRARQLGAFAVGRSSCRTCENRSRCKHHGCERDSCRNTRCRLCSHFDAKWRRARRAYGNDAEPDIKALCAGKPAKAFAPRAATIRAHIVETIQAPCEPPPAHLVKAHVHLTVQLGENLEDDATLWRLLWYERARRPPRAKAQRIPSPVAAEAVKIEPVTA